MNNDTFIQGSSYETTMEMKPVESWAQCEVGFLGEGGGWHKKQSLKQSLIDHWFMKYPCEPQRGRVTCK
jgi:hypothetical protein